jgi:mono/diheme cytochrome c family protein
MVGMSKLTIIVAGLVACVACEAKPEIKVDFAKDIQPILQNSCLECHGPEKTKGGLRLDTKELTLKGGKNGAVLVPGQADKSELYLRTTLPADNDDVMPNKGDKLTKAQTDFLRDWINQGAEWPEGVVLVSVAKKAEETATTAPASPKFPDYKPAAAELKAIKDLEALGVAVRPIAMNLGWQDVNFLGQRGQAVDKALVPLRGLVGVVDLNLAGTRFQDADLVNLEGLTNLTRLHLENTPITDAGMVHLQGLANLTYLNLYGTAITDAGLKQIEGLTKLEHLYLWQTKTTAEGVANLKRALPAVDISTGAEFKEIAKPEEKKDEPKTERK